MKSTIKKTITLSMIFILAFSLCGCSLFDSRAKVYSRYAISLLDINYKNVSKDYMTLTGVSQKDAEAVYVDNMDYQAHNLMNYYGVKEVDDGTILSEFYYLAQSIFANAKYEVTDVKKDKENDAYTLELTVYPLDTLEASYDEVVQYIEDFNTKVDDGNYNNTTEVEYETEFAEGIINILKAHTSEPGYMDPVVLEIPIQPSDDYYYITDDDFLKIDQNILYIRENPTASSTDTEAADGESNTKATEAADTTDNATDTEATEAADTTDSATDAETTEAAQ
ncbi:MAG: hypothetical protein PUC55_02095 [Lachnospiraceae bacterium]|nr:hypothetical protein [Lachnospiraceae bacterium]